MRKTRRKDRYGGELERGEDEVEGEIGRIFNIKTFHVVIWSLSKEVPQNFEKIQRRRLGRVGSGGHDGKKESSIGEGTHRN